MSVDHHTSLITLCNILVVGSFFTSKNKEKIHANIFFEIQSVKLISGVVGFESK